MTNSRVFSVLLVLRFCSVNHIFLMLIYSHLQKLFSASENPGEKGSVNKLLLTATLLSSRNKHFTLILNMST